jgi:hypothetical protein
MDFILAHSRYKRQKYAEAIQVCDELLAKNSKDEVKYQLTVGCVDAQM